MIKLPDKEPVQVDRRDPTKESSPILENQPAKPAKERFEPAIPLQAPMPCVWNGINYAPGAVIVVPTGPVGHQKLRCDPRGSGGWIVEWSSG